jgi:hypothetical protein
MTYSHTVVTCRLLTPVAARFYAPGFFFWLYTTHSCTLTLFQYVSVFSPSWSLMKLNHWPLVAALVLNTFPGTAACSCLPQTQRTHSSQSCGLWNLRTVHRGCAASANEPNQTQDTKLLSLRQHVARTQPQLFWDPQSELNCLVHAYNMFRGEKLLTPEGLHSHTCNNLQLDATYIHLVSLDRTDLCAARGDFSFHCLNHFCLTTQSTAFIGKRIVLFTPVEAVFKTLRQHDHRGLLLTASSTGANGHFTAIRCHANGKYYV